MSIMSIIAFPMVFTDIISHNPIDGGRVAPHALLIRQDNEE